MLSSTVIIYSSYMTTAVETENINQLSYHFSITLGSLLSDGKPMLYGQRNISFFGTGTCSLLQPYCFAFFSRETPKVCMDEPIVFTLDTYYVTFHSAIRPSRIPTKYKNRSLRWSIRNGQPADPPDRAVATCPLWLLTIHPL